MPYLCIAMKIRRTLRAVELLSRNVRIRKHARRPLSLSLMVGIGMGIHTYMIQAVC